MVTAYKPNESIFQEIPGTGSSIVKIDNFGAISPRNLQQKSKHASIYKRPIVKWLRLFSFCGAVFRTCRSNHGKWRDPSATEEKNRQC